ncbi:MFS transporter [Gordonia sp. N1V]|uniref:MFS transporter n=1 Tax=Gordonia sp. N1V TaxID=3034163 RepID=UPI0023E1A4C9|nr:MFS transporter [Gordonia sp. N1V]MDF3281044.1 MFS transporter [Gordonia sp. N1V]
MVVIVENTITNVALPSIQRDLGYAQSLSSWVVTAYALTFGTLLLVGGRIAQTIGYRRAALIGLVGFCLASGLGGAAQGFGMLVAARTLQGVFAALLAPTVLAALSSNFPTGTQRARAFGILAAVTGIGVVAGSVLGGVLTEYLSWRWTLYATCLLSAVTIVGVLFWLRSAPTGRRHPIDAFGVTLSAVALFTTVYGFTEASRSGWTSPIVIGTLAISACSYVAFLIVESRVQSPLLALRVLGNRVRSAAYLNRLTTSISTFGLMFMMTYLLQDVMNYSAVATGFAMAPMVVGIIVGSNAGSLILLRTIGARGAATVGMLIAGGALIALTRISPYTQYAPDILVPLLIFGFGQGIATTVAMNVATMGLDTDDIGAGSALVNVMQQVGGAVGPALLATIAATSISFEDDPSIAAQIDGYSAGFVASAAIIMIGAVLVWLLGTSSTPIGDAVDREPPTPHIELEP